MTTKGVARSRGFPDWLLAFGPFFVIAGLLVIAFGAISLFDVESALAVSGTLEVLAILTVIGFIAGILPVVVGMLWYPYFRHLDVEWVHAVLAFSMGILAFIAVEMAGGAAGQAANASDGTLAAGIGVGAALGTVVVMELGSRWRKRQTQAAGSDNLRIAYLVAIGLGLHSIGEGLAIGNAFILEETGLVVLFTVGFIIHNVTEGPAIIAALARETRAPPLRHFGALGVLAGGGVIIGGWVGTLGEVPLVATAFFAIAFGAILQVIWEMTDLMWTDTDSPFTRRTVVAFVLGVLVLFVLEDIVVEGLLGV